MYSSFEVNSKEGVENYSTQVKTFIEHVESRIAKTEFKYLHIYEYFIKVIYNSNVTFTITGVSCHCISQC